MMDCFYCLSLWAAAPVALLIASDWAERLMLWPALSAGAILTERASGRSEPPAAAAYYSEAEEESDELLRKEEEGTGVSDTATDEADDRDAAPSRVLSIRR